uniref:hypothetical protein n=1 Tax=Chitinimonas sp. TaxID=1934313 RepID=UPI0035B4B837
EQQNAAIKAGDDAGSATIGQLLARWQPAAVDACAEPACAAAPKRPAWQRFGVMIAIWVALLLGAQFALNHGIDRHIVGAGLVLGAMASHALAFLVGLLGMLPVIGPLLIKILSIPVIWLLNSIGYLVSVMAIRRGYSKDVLTYRGLTIALITGIVIGYIIGKVV